jgi:hypothetical protein
MTIDREQAVIALVTLATVLFLLAGAPGFRYRRVARLAALAVYGVVMAGVLVYVALWLFGMAPGR